MKNTSSVYDRKNYAKHVFVFFLLLAASLRAQNATWNWPGGSNGTGDYLVASNWVGGSLPAINGVAFFGTNVGTVTLGANATNGETRFGTLGNGGTTILQTGLNSLTTGAFFQGRGNVGTTGTIDGGTLNITGSFFVVGNDGGANSNRLVLTNSATVNSAVLLQSGRSLTTNNATVVTGASTLNVNGVQVGPAANARSNSVLVTGAGSKIVSSNLVLIGNGVNSVGNQLVVSNGGSVSVSNATASSARIYFAGFGAQGDGTADGNNLLVTGAGSTFTTTGDRILIYQGGTNADSLGNSITVADGGTLTATAATLDGTATTSAAAGSKNAINVQGGTINVASLSYNTTLNVSDGALNVSGGISRNSGGALNFSGGTITARSASWLGGTSLVIGDGNTATTATWSLTNGASLGSAASTTIDIRGDGVLSGSGTVGIAGATTNAGTILANAGSSMNFSNGLTMISGQISGSGTVTSTNSYNMRSGTVSANLAGTAGLTKTTTGTLTLSGNNTYSGATTVSAGALIVDGSLGSAATVESGATLGGSGTLASATISGIHSPGNSPGIQTFTNGLTYNSGATFVWELTANSASGRGSIFDGVDVTGGTLTINTGVTNNLLFNSSGSSVLWSDAFWDSNQSWRVFEAAGVVALSSNVFDAVNIGLDSGNNALTSVRSGAGFNWSTVDSDIYLNYVVPEPSTYALLVLGAAGLAGHMVRRRRR
jgi:fibronectin-binding autotransporter adhesin